jgi:Ca-activated chloride channel family protein
MTNERTTHDAGHDAGRDDPRLTAYALGELDGQEHAAARAEIKALLATDAEARDEVARVRELAETLKTELGAEAAAGHAPVLGDARHAALDAALAERAAGALGTGGAGSGTTGRLNRRPVLLRYAPAMAAMLLVGMALWAAWDWNSRTGLEAPADSGGAASAPVAVADKLKSMPYLGDEKKETGQLGYLVAGGDQGEQEPLPFAYDRFADGPEFAAEAVRQEGALGRKASTVNNEQAPDGVVLFTEAGVSADRDDSMAKAAPGLAARATPGQADGSEASEDVVRMLEQLGYDGGVSGGAVAHDEAEEGRYAGGADRLSGRGRRSKAEGAVREVARSAAPSAPAAVGVGLAGGASDAFDAETPVEPEVAADDNRHAERRHDYRYWRTPPTPGSEYYAPIVEAGFQSPIQAPLSTFSVDVDTASYANVRRFLNQGGLPPKDAVRIEELVNYFRYDYAPPEDGEAPFATHVAVAECPWAPAHRLVRIGIKGREVPQGERAASNLVFLVDVSGSMSSQDKLPLLVSSLKLLVNKLDERDRVALVTYAGNAGLVLESTRCDGPGRTKVLDALERLRSGGSTHGSAGIQLAYRTATDALEKGGINRVILATDGDFNVGVTDRDDLHRLITSSAKSGVFLSVLGFGTGNLKDGTAELLADKGNGNYSYIDSLGEAQKVLVNEMGGTLVTIAKDVKLQVEFNPAKVEAYRLVGYENRTLAAQDFNDDKKDAGEIGAGHTVTALYEVVPPGAGGYPSVDDLKYQEKPALQTPDLVESEDLLNVKLRWKEPDEDVSTKIEVPVVDEGRSLAQAGPDMAFASAVASFGMLLRGSDHAGSATWDTVLELAERGRGEDRDGYRAEFLRLAQVAKGLTGN